MIIKIAKLQGETKNKIRKLKYLRVFVRMFLLRMPTNYETTSTGHNVFFPTQKINIFFEKKNTVHENHFGSISGDAEAVGCAESQNDREIFMKRLAKNEEKFHKKFRKK